MKSPDARVELDTGEFHIEVDGLVAGAGGCGLVAGLAAAHASAETLILEKQVRPQSNTACSGGMFPAAGTRLQRAVGVRDAPEDFAADILAQHRGACERERVLHLATTACELVHWLVDEIGSALGFVGDFTYPGHTSHRMHALPSRTGAQLAEGRSA